MGVGDKAPRTHLFYNTDPIQLTFVFFSRAIIDAMKKIALFRVWDTHPIDKSIVKVIEKHFPEYVLEVFTLMDFLRARKMLLILNIFVVIRYYGFRILRGELGFRESFLRTPYLFKKINAYAKSILKNNGPYAFSFQLQSLFDTASSSTPHFIYTDHTHLENLNYPDFAQQDLFAPAWIGCEQEIYTNASLIFTRSTNISRSLIEQYACPTKKIFCVYGGSNIPLDEKRVIEQRVFNMHILFVGIDWERKGGTDLLAAFNLVLQKHPGARLTLVGAHPEITHPKIRVVGRVQSSEMPDYYRAADIFCVPTKQEPFGAVFIEALAYQLPIIATQIGAIPDFVIPGKNGYLVAPGDVSALAGALTDLLNDPNKCARFGKVGYQLAQDRYNWDQVGNRIRQHILAALKAE